MKKIKLLLSVFFLLNLSSIYSQCALYTFKSGSGSICANDQVTLTALAAQPSYGNGNQGALTVSGTTSVDATRSAVFGAIGVVGSNSIQVASASGFAIGNEVLIISMQDSTKSNLNVTGKYEFRIISAISSNTLTFTQPLVNNYLVNAATKHQVILVPNYSNVTVNNGGLLTCSNWDGTTGGVLCFRANGNLTVNSGGIISASAKGYRGLSHAALWRNKDGAQGEGIYGQGFIGGNSNGSNGYWNLKNGNGGGGGTGTGDAAGGGGGSYGSLGTDGVDWGGHFKGRKGDTISNPGVTRLYFGGAGGEGGGDEDGAYPGKGGNGGGIIYIAAVSITNNGNIYSNGETGGNGCNNCGGSGSGMGGGAGGAGGTIELGLNTFSGAGNSIAVSGGTLGTGYGAGNGGAGGNGRIRFDMTSAPPVTTPIAFQGIPNPIAGVTFSWSTGATTSSIVVSPTVTSGYTVVVTSTAACSGLSSSQNLTVNPQTATLTVNTPTVCAGFPATLIASGGGLLPNSIPNLVAYYKFDEGTGGTTADLSGNNLTGTLVNTPVWGASTASILPTAGNALTYNNSNNYVNIADAPILSSLQNSLTIEAWVYPTDNSNNTIIDRASYNFLFATHSNGQPGLGFYNPNTNWQYSTASVPINVWSHVALTWEHNGTNGILKFYINGVFSNQISINNTLSFNAGNINIGRQEPNSCQCNIFGGKIDEVKVWNVSRSQAQIAADRNFSLHSYSWSGGISNGVPFTPTTSASYTVSNQFGCATPVSVLVSAPPLAISNPSAICPGGGPVVLTASGASSYTWSTGSNNATISVTPSITTTYTVSGTAPNGCFIPEFRTVVVNVVPTISIINPGTIPNCSSATLTASAPMVGTGGVITYSNGYAIHTFTSTGLFNMPSTGALQALIVAGGGGGGSDMGGGGGGGGVIYSPNLVVNTGSYNIVIGAGGNGAPAGNSQVRGFNGQNSSAFSFTAIGGGGGASNHDGSTNPAGNGGSGGGASGGGTLPNGGSGGGGYGGGIRGLGTSGQGYDGGSGIYAWYPGGGGGAGGVGLTQPATGGSGIRHLAISPFYWAGGGGGSGYSADGGNGGIGGGGGGAVGVTTGGAGFNNGSAGGGGSQNSQANVPGGNAGANTGGGGGGGAHYSANNNGGIGGSGIVIIKYLIPANPAYSYTWSNGANSSSIVVSPTINTTYSVTLTNTTGCSGNSSVITLSVMPLNVQIVSPGTIPNCSSGILTAMAYGSTPIIQTYTLVGANSFSVPAGINNVEYLIVAGGGGAGNSNGSGGGGGGGVLTGTLNVTPGQTYSINVGAGGSGAANTSTCGSNGQNSSAFSLVAIGGGGSGSESSFSAGRNGGSGGGGVRGGVGGAGTSGQGFAGGSNVNDGAPHYSGGGGGGAGGAGTNGSASTVGVGGVGIQSSITGVATYYGGGGGAGSYNNGSGQVSSGAGGLGGGAMGGTNPSDGRNRNGSPNTGGGASGGGRWADVSGSGGSGIVIVKYYIPSTTTYSYAWSNGGANSSSIVVSPTVNTSYSVVLTNSAGCSANSSPITLSITPLNIQIVNPGTIPNCTSGTLQAFALGNPVTFTYSAIGASTFVAPAGLTSLQYLIVAGGGGGGSDMGGGGGGGGVLSGTTSVTPGQTYTINIGAGGNGAPVGTGQVRGFNGQNSSAFSFTAIGGGGGASTHNNSNSPAGIGGSGGGASGGGLQAGGYGGVNAAGTPGQGNAGGAGAGTWYPGGGGGAGGVGLNQPATGGPGIQYLSFSPLYWAGGGGGAGHDGNSGNGGIGGGGGGGSWNGYSSTGGAGINNGSGGGAGNSTPGGNAGANTGGGGGGGTYYNSNNNGGNGGSGIVIIKYNQPVVQNFTYTWSNGGANSSSIVVSPTVNTTYSVVLTNSAGCSSNSSPITLSVTPLNILVTASPSLICNGQSATLTASAPILGTGGSMTILNGYAIHTFTNVGASTFTPPSAASVEYLIVAGGGGSGASNGTGGGGGGGVLTGTTNLLGGQVYTINVGAGGSGAVNQSTRGSNGANSSAFSLVALGGGGSGSENGPFLGGASGGSGGAGVRSGVGGAGTVGQGFAGGSNVNDGGPHYSGGGGGGAGAAGTNGSAGTLGVGGNGIQSAISGTATYYGGGGGAGSYSGMASAGAGGLGGGAMGGTNPSDGRGRNGSPNTGGGGAGTGNVGNPGGNGGSGIVIVKYLIPASQNYTYTWSNGGANSSSIVVTPNTNTNYSVVLSNTSGCSSPLISPITLSVTQLQAPITGMSTVCAGITVTLNAAISSTPATGGVITYSNGYTIHTFTSSGTFSAPSNQNIDYLVVAGGGGSGGFGGGGGAGGAILGSATVSGSFAVVVGAGGNGESTNDGGGTNGANSSFNSVVAIGGGTGRHSQLGTNGGSGGGNGYGIASPTSSFVSGQGSSGGFGNSTGPGYPGGGGGGATGVGGNASANSGGTAGNAGAGLLSSISGAPVYYAVGGPGSARSGGVSGSASTGGSSVGQDGAPNTGNGGGGGLVTWVGKNGGSGVVIIRYQPISVASYTWSNGANTQSITINPTVTTSYSVAFTTTTGCIGTSTLATVNVNPLPVVSISGSSAICVGQTATLVANGANTYTWSNASTASSITLSPASNTSYSLTGTAAGCIGSATTNLTVNANPIITVNSGAICAGQNFTINPNGANTYTIQGGNAVVSPAGNTSYTVAGTSTAGCVSQAFATSNLIVNANPIITVNNGAICAGQNFTINPNGANTYTIQGGNAVVSPSINTTYTVIGTNTITGCVSQAFATSNLTVNPNPTITVNNGAICVGQNFTINPNGANTYTIQGGNAVVSPPSNTSFTVIGTNSVTGCRSQAFATSNLTVNPNPIITVNNGTICAGQNFTINPNGANTYTIQGGNAVVSPPSNAIFTVVGTSTAGCVSQAFATSSLIVNVNPTITVNSGAICAGQNFTINPNGANTYTIQGGNALVSPPSNASFTVAGTNTLTGCVSQAFATSNLTVNPNPTITVNNGTICVGQNFTINPNGANTYTIQGGNAVVSPPSNAIFTVAGTSTAGCVSQAVATSSLIVNANPIITVNNGTICAGQNFTINPNGANTYTIQGGNAVVSPPSNAIFTVAGTSTAGCVSQAVAISSLIVNPNPTITVNNGAICAGQNFTINPNGANTYTIQGANAVVSPSINTSYTVIGTNTITGCLSQAFATSNLTVNPNPIVTITGTNAICANGSTSLTVNGATTYTWSSGSTSASVVFSPSATSVYSVVGSYSTGCLNATTQTVTVYSLPVVSISGPSVVCLGDSIALVANGANTYVWNNNATTTTIVITPTTTSTYSAVGTDTNGCVGLSAIDSIFVNPVPILSIISTATAICVGDTVKFTAAGANSYVWNIGDNDSLIVVTPTITTTYSVVGTNGFGCTSTKIDSIKVNALPNITISGTTGTICIGENITLTANGANTYTWSGGINTNSIAVSPSVSTTYSASGTSTDGCVGSNTLQLNVTECTNIKTIASKAAIKVYPNPNHGEFIIELVSVNNSNITITNVLGQIIKTQKAELMNQIDLNLFDKGIYFINVMENNQSVYRGSIIKQ